jgi:hypothetical protein
MNWFCPYIHFSVTELYINALLIEFVPKSRFTNNEESISNYYTAYREYIYVKESCHLKIIKIKSKLGENINLNLNKTLYKGIQL